MTEAKSQQKKPGGVVVRVWPEAVRRQAFELFAGPAQGNQSETARLLSAAVGETVPLSTVKGWAERESWIERTAPDSVAVIGTTMEQYVSRLWVASLPSLSLLSSVASGSLTATDPEDADNLDRRIAAARFIVEKAQALLLQQAKQGPKQKQGAEAVRPAIDISQLSSEQLQELESSGTVGR